MALADVATLLIVITTFLVVTAHMCFGGSSSSCNRLSLCFKVSRQFVCLFVIAFYLEIVFCFYLLQGWRSLSVKVRWRA